MNPLDKPSIKEKILTHSIEEDQFFVAEQWAKTFRYNETNDTGIKIMQLLAGCVAAGDFKICPAFSSTNQFQEPSKELSVADYLSHGSRIILDYEKLSPENKEELKEYFPAPNSKNGVFYRSATHSVTRDANKVVENKGIGIGIMGQLKNVLPFFKENRYDFGVNVAMGGRNQKNFDGKGISNNGFSGHVYFHHNKRDDLLLVGLEQTTPEISIFESKDHENVIGNAQHGKDQFGQKHSLVGHSDIYTAAGSLYFSNPIYQAKLMGEKKYFPPKKYGGMKVTLSDHDWPKIKEYLNRLRVCSTDEFKLLFALIQRPSTASSARQGYSSYINLDFKNYLKHAYTVFIKNSHLTSEEQQGLQKKQDKLLVLIKKLPQKDKATVFQLIEEIINHSSIPSSYKKMIKHIEKLLHIECDHPDKESKAAGRFLLFNNLQAYCTKNAPDYEKNRMGIK